MLRLFFFLIFALFGYFIISIIGQLDFAVTISAIDYRIQTTFVVIVASFILSVFALAIILKYILVLLNLPLTIKARIVDSHHRKINQYVLDSFAKFIIDDKLGAQRLAEKCYSASTENYKELCGLILSQTEQDFHKKVDYYKGLLGIKEYKLFAAIHLIKLYYTNSYYRESLQQAEPIIDYVISDKKLSQITIDCCVKLSLWDEFHKIVKKVRKQFNADALEYITFELSNSYVKAARHAMDTKQNSKLQEYLNCALEIMPSNLQALELKEVIKNSK